MNHVPAYVTDHAVLARGAQRTLSCVIGALSRLPVLLAACERSPDAHAIESRAAEATPLASDDAPAPPSSDRVRTAIDGMLREAYGADKYDAARECWRHDVETAGGPQTYCMTSDTPQLVPSRNGFELYFQTYSDPDAVPYALTDSGLQGLVAAYLDADGTWRTLASSPALDRGQAGDCGCLDDRVVRVGPETHGWLGVSGGIWQGIEVSQYALHIPVDGVFRDVSTIPRKTEDDQASYNEIAIDDETAPTAGLYPLLVTRRSDTSVVESRRVVFDPGRGHYPWAP